MLANRNQTSSKFYKEVPCVLAKGLSAKYQCNPKCKSVKRLCLPICGDKGKQIKIVEGGVRIPAIFKKAVIPCQFPLPVYGFIRHVDIFKRNGCWFIAYAYNTACAKLIKPVNCVGVDRNSVGNMAALADPNTGKVWMLGVSAGPFKHNFRCRKARLMSQGKKRLVSRLRRKQSRRTRYENHRVSKAIVDYASKTSSAIAVEKLKFEPGEKATRYTQRSQFAYSQLMQFLAYKAVLAGVPVVEVDPAYTSQECSRCGQRNKPERKVYRCSRCGSKTHRDANSGFVIAKRGWRILSGGNAGVENEAPAGHIDMALSGNTGQSKSDTGKRNLSG
jgi:IS605 OrfB family transposase